MLTDHQTSSGSFVRCRLGDGRRVMLRMGLALGVVWMAACSATDAPVRPARDARPSADVRSYLLNPLEGYEFSVGAEDSLRIDSGYDALITRGDSATTMAVSRQLLSRDDRHAPASLLAAQVQFVAGNYSAVVERLTPHVDQWANYRAAVLVLARSHDLLGDEVRAFELYRSIEDSLVADRRERALLDPVLERLSERLQSALAASELETAESIVDQLDSFAPQSLTALVAGRDVAAISGDQARELALWQQISTLESLSEVDRRRIAELEVEVGDPTQGVAILQQLVDRSPDDYTLREALESAQFSWRLSMLPPSAASVVRSDRLSRADLATLLYWVVPGARSGSAQAAVIATDIPLDHPQRREVVRVLNLGLMPMSDPALRRFDPDQPISLIATLDTLLRTPARRQVTLACTRGYERRERHRASETCAAAARCAIVADEDACSTDRPLTGSEARELIRRTLNLLGGAAPQ